MVWSTSTPHALTLLNESLNLTSARVGAMKTISTQTESTPNCDIGKWVHRDASTKLSKPWLADTNINNDTNVRRKNSLMKSRITICSPNELIRVYHSARMVIVAISLRAVSRNLSGREGRSRAMWLTLQMKKYIRVEKITPFSCHRGFSRYIVPLQVHRALLFSFKLPFKL